MKKNFFCIVFCLATLPFLAQEKEEFNGFSKNDFYLSGMFSYNSIDDGNSSINSLNFNPMAGYFFDESYSLDFGFVIASNKNGQSKSNSLGAQLGLTHFFNPKDKFSFTFGGTLLYLTTDYENGFLGDYKSDIFQIALVPGINYFITNNLALRANIGVISYISQKDDLPGSEAINSFDMSFNLSNINLGFLLKL